MNSKKNSYDIAGCILVTIIATVICCISIRIWEIDLTVLPREIGGDATLASFLIKSIQQNGLKGIFVNYMVGAPDVSYLIEVPFLDINLVLLIYFVNMLTKNYVVTYYAVYILSYSLTALSMYLFLSHLHLKYLVKAVCSILFAVAPYHFIRSFEHITLSNYATIPIGLYLSFVILEGGFSIFTKNERHKKINWKSVWVMLAAILVGTGQLYYAFFSLIVMGVALLIKMIKDKTFKPLLREGIIIYIVCVFVLLGIAPKVIFGMIYGENTLAGVRVPMEAELYGMKIIQLLLPTAYSRLPFLAKMNQEYNISGVTVIEDGASSLGIIASCSFIFVCGWFIYSFVSKKQCEEPSSRLDFLSLGTLTIVLFCTIGGIGAIFNYLVTPQVRAFNRASILIACMVLTAGALVLDKIRKKTLYVVICIAVMVVGLYDQVPIAEKGWQNQLQVSQNMYETFFNEVEASAEEGSMIYELPFMNFPESEPQNRMKDYTPLAGYLFTDTLRWSYGGIKGRNTAAEALYIDEGKSADFVAGIKDSGFAGVYIDSYGYADNGEEIVAFYRSLGLEEIVSMDQRFYFFKL